ncbi:hypothetical protein N7492_001225 [Penicillium capsulatum]|uniref:F-box domain-containing protein n=1 Tax=Penicillium capsulatum TaxID=69766 RepID=A0A9W9M050_9EURO|nr:hypothetical protein N7492_001225 [Penicillium capsulatum]KAJ6129717.1 hypothetical protein N7512_002497 [Penicillium capsulatum]
MGSWDYYCALCGSTFRGAHFVSRKPRTARFLWRKQRDAEFDAMVGDDPSNGRIDFRKFNEETAAGEENFDNESLSSQDEEHTYDCDIISQEEALWSLNLQCLGLNPDSPLLSKAFLSDIGSPDDYGAVCAGPGSDPSAPDDLEYSAYDQNEDYPLFPFHPKCFDLFQQVVAFKRGFQVGARPLPNGDWELNVPCRDLDKDALWEVFYPLNDISQLEISYGDPSPPQDQYWLVDSGEELFIADPGRRNPLAANVISDAWREIDCPASDPDIKSMKDPIAKLPFELILLITSKLPSDALLNLLQASPHLRRGLDSSFSFWRPRFEKDMPWFYEMHSFLHEIFGPANHDAMEASGKSLSRFFAWAHHATTPRLKLRGPFMGIANRRRIWEVCQQLVDPYLEQAKAEYSSSQVGEESQFRSDTICLDMPVVTSPPLNHFHTERVFWVRNWSEYNARNGDFTFNTFWKGEDLVGLGVVMNSDQDPRQKVFGLDNHDEDVIPAVTVKSMRIGQGDWITGFILYWPDTSDGWRKPGNKNGVMAITVLCSSGHKETFGDMYNNDVKRPLLSKDGMTIVGLMGHYGMDHFGHEGKRFDRLGLLQVPAPDVNYGSRPQMVTSAENTTMPTWAESMAWMHDCTDIFTDSSRLSSSDAPSTPFTRAQSYSGVPIWDVPNLHIQQPSTYAVSNNYPDDLVAYHPLIWAKNVEEARALRRLTGYVREGDMASGFEDGRTWERPLHHLCGARADFAPESTIQRRCIGMVEHESDQWQLEHCVDIDIDGAGGEMITSVAVVMERCSPKALRLITNRGREVYWGEADKPEGSWQVLMAPEGEMLIGIVLAFSRPSAWDEETKSFLRSKMSSFAVLSLPMA